MINSCGKYHLVHYVTQSHEYVKNKKPAKAGLLIISLYEEQLNGETFATCTGPAGIRVAEVESFAIQAFCEFQRGIEEV